MQIGGLTEQIQLVAIGILIGMVLYFLFLKPRIERRVEKNILKRKDQFVSLASHYLLTPISIIQSALTRLQEADTMLDSEKRHKLYDAIGVGQQRLWIIAEHLVLVNEIDQGTLEISAEVADVSGVVSNAMSDVDIFARTKKVILKLEDGIKESSETRFDARRLRQAIVALLDNAIKFSADGDTVTLRLSFSGKKFRIEVEDHGIGMPEEVLSHLSEKFYRGTPLYNYDYEGIGLGLYIAFAIIQFHQGTLTYSSNVQKGTVAIVEFPSL